MIESTKRSVLALALVTSHLATFSSRFVASPLLSLWGSAKRWDHVIVQVHNMDFLACQGLLLCQVLSILVHLFPRSDFVVFQFHAAVQSVSR